MKTRTLLLLSVGCALMILLAGGALLVQLARQESTVEATPLGVSTQVGDAEVTVIGPDSSTDAGASDGLLRVAVEIGGVDDESGIDGFALVTGDRRLTPVSTGGPGRCAAITVAARRCTIDFDISASEGSSRVLVLRRGENQATWRLS